MTATLAAAGAVVLFMVALGAFLLGTEDRLVGIAVLAGLVALSVAVADHVTPQAPPSR